MSVSSSAGSDIDIDSLSILEVVKQINLNHKNLQTLYRALAIKHVASSDAANGVAPTNAIEVQPTRMLTPYFESIHVLSVAIEESIFDSLLMDSLGKPPEPIQDAPATKILCKKSFSQRNQFDNRQLITWALANTYHPYPSRDKKQQFATDSGMSFQQVSHWFINLRKRHLKLLK